MPIAKQHTIYFVGILLIIGLGVFLQFAHPSSSATPSAKLEKQIDNPQLLNALERNTELDTLLEILAVHDPKQAMLALRQRSAEDGRVLRSCHPLVHKIGQSAYLKYQSVPTALEFRDDFCNSGYIHGVIEARFAEGIDQAGLLTVCAGETGLRGWECWHGIGHGLMYANENNLPDALARCDQLPITADQNACQNGVFMENFNADDRSHQSIYRSADEPLYPCAGQAERHRGNCYLYAPAYFLALNPGAYAQALSICRTAPAAWQSACTTGVGSELAKQNLDRLGEVIHWCTSGLSNQTDECQSGFISYLYLHVGGQAEAGHQLCDQLTTQPRQVCYDRMARADQF